VAAGVRPCGLVNVRPNEDAINRVAVVKDGSWDEIAEALKRAQQERARRTGGASALADAPILVTGARIPSSTGAPADLSEAADQEAILGGLGLPQGFVVSAPPITPDMVGPEVLLLHDPGSPIAGAISLCPHPPDHGQPRRLRASLRNERPVCPAKARPSPPPTWASAWQRVASPAGRHDRL